MGLDVHNIWQPTPDYVEGAQVTALAHRLGVEDFDELYDFSLSNPERYWREVLDFCQVKLDREYEILCDLKRGAPFPLWFVGAEMNWTDMVLDREEDRDRTAIIAESEVGTSRSVTYAELAEEVRAFATGLEVRGIRRGDRVGLLMENGIEASVSFLAIAYIGAIVVPLFSGFGSDAIVSRLAPCGARALITTSGFYRRGRFIETTGTLAAVRHNLPGLECVIVKGSQAAAVPDDTIDWYDVPCKPEVGRRSARMSPNDPFMVIFTSGTTGRPKGVVHVHGGFPIKIAHDAAVHFNVGSGDVFCWPADMGWIAGALVLGAALLRGATLVCYDGAPDYPDWSRMGQLVERYKVTHFGSAPTLIRGLAAHHKVATGPDLGSIKLLITAGEAIAPEHFVWFEKVFGRGDCPLINYTGGTEVSGALLSSVVTKPIVPGGFNARSPGVAVDVIDPEGRSLKGSIGELAVRAPFIGMTASFWNDEDRYLESYWQIIPDIWVHGDLALHTEDGHYFILGRSDDTIKVAGKRVGPGEVEGVLIEIDGVIEAAVIGAASPDKGQTIVAFLTCEDAPEDICALARARIKDRLGAPFVPSAVYMVSQLPKTRSSKIMRRVIRSVHSGSPPGDLSSLVNPEVIDEIARVIKNE